jgi:hypothetical protein
VLADAGLTMDAVAARTFSVRIGDFERISRMTQAAEARRNAALHELDIHRASFALRLRRALHAVEEIELRVIAPAGPAPRELDQLQRDWIVRRAGKSIDQGR